MPLPLYPALVCYVLANLRDHDAAEIMPLVAGPERLQGLADALCTGHTLGAVFLHEDVPAAAIGANPQQPGVWGVWMAATEAWPHVWRQVVRYARGDLERGLRERGVRRVQANSLVSHPEAGRMLQWLGFQREGRARGFGSQGQDYYLWSRLPDDPAGIMSHARAA